MSERRRDSKYEKRYESTSDRRRESSRERIRSDSTTERRRESGGDRRHESTTERRRESGDRRHESTTERRRESGGERRQDSTTERRRESGEKRQESTTERRRDSGASRRQSSTTEKRRTATGEKPHRASAKPMQVSLEEAMKTVETLDRLPLVECRTSVEPQPISLDYHVDFATNFCDREGYKSGVARYLEEATVHAQLNTMLEEGQQHAIMLYTWRCISRGLPQVKSNEQANRNELYVEVAAILEPHIARLLKFHSFQKRAIGRFCDEVGRLCHRERRSEFVSESYLLTLGKLISMFVELNELTNIKASVKNDISAYRKALNVLRMSTSPDALVESDKLSMDIATQNHIRDAVKRGLQEIDGYEELLSDIINTCLHLYENDMFLAPAEKHVLVKVVVFGLFLMDSATVSIYKLDGRKRINLSRVDKILKHLQVVPLYGDMQMEPYQYIRNSPNFDPNKWPGCESTTHCTQADFVSNLPGIRQDHVTYVSLLGSIGVKRDLVGKVSTGDSDNKELARLALRGLRLLAKWTHLVVELFSWKLYHPTSHHDKEECPEDAEDYERATRYNYTGDEKCALIEVIGMIKGVQMLLDRLQPVFYEAARCHIYSELQEFVQNGLKEPLRKAVKHKNDIIKMLILGVREMSADWLRGAPPENDPCLKGKKDPDKNFVLEVPRKKVAPSSTQLYMVRTMLESLVSTRGKKTFRKEIDEASIRSIEAFHKQSFFWEYLLHFDNSLEACCDLSQLWYREFFLELTMGKRIQFPIEMSMPWILTDHVLETKNSAMIEYILYPLDLYNDAANCALNHFHKQYLYAEVEAEVNLCFDQFVYKLSDQIFSYYKQLAGSTLLDKRFQKECVRAGLKLAPPPATRYQTLLQQRHVQILGRSVDLHSLLSQRLRAALIKSMEVAISRFEAGDLTGIIELESLIACNRLTHALLSEHVVLGDFEAIYLEADDSVNSPVGRILFHVQKELTYDFLPYYCYNAATNRFVKRKQFVEELKRDKAQSVSPQYIWGSKELTNAFTTASSLYSGFVGQPHFRALCALLGHQGVAIIVADLLNTMAMMLSPKGEVYEYVTELMRAMPDSVKLHRYEYGSVGIFIYFMEALKDILQYQPLKVEVFQGFAEVGNALLVCLMLEHSLVQEDANIAKHAGPFQGVIPRPYIPNVKGRDPEKQLQEAMAELKSRYEDLHLNTVVGNLNPNAQVVSMVKDAQELTMTTALRGRSLFVAVLERLRAIVDRPLWHGERSSNRLMNVDHSKEFHRLWSTFQWVICLPVGQGEFTIEEMFGEGLNWAGCALIMVLRQRRRFEALDFSYHLFKINHADQKDSGVSGIDFKRVINRVRKYQFLNNQIFSLLERHLEPQSHSAESDPEITHFNPPST